MSKKEGFTVVELIVAMGLFVILLGIVSGSFINALRTQRRIVALVAANDNANISLEQMAREIRTGVSGTFDLVPLSVNTDLQFTNAKGEMITYRKNDKGIEREVKAGSGDSVKQTITADNVNITSLKFVLCDPNDCGKKARVTIALGVSPNDPDPALAGTILHMQTTISARF